MTLTFPPLIAVFVIGGWAFLKHASLRVLASAVVLAPFAVTALFAAAKAAVRPQDATRYSLIVAAARRNRVPAGGALAVDRAGRAGSALAAEQQLPRSRG